MSSRMRRDYSIRIEKHRGSLFELISKNYAHYREGLPIDDGYLQKYDRHRQIHILIDFIKESFAAVLLCKLQREDGHASYIQHIRII